SLPAGSQRTELLEQKSQLRSLLNISKETVKQQKLEDIEHLIKTQERNNEKGTALKEDMLEQAENQLHDLKRLMNSFKMEQQESGKLQVLKGRLAKLNLTDRMGEPLSVSKAKSSNTGLAGDIIDNDALSPETGTKLAHMSAHMERLMRDQWRDEDITRIRDQMQWIKGELNNLKSLGLLTGEFKEVSKQFEELKVKDFHHRLDKLKDKLEDKLEKGNIGSSKDIQSIERDIKQLSKCFDELALVGGEERSQLRERQEALSNQLVEIKRHFTIHNDIKLLATDLEDFKHRDLPDFDQIIKFFNHIEDSLREIGTLIDSLPAGSPRTELLEQKSQLRSLLSTNKETVKQQKLESIEHLIKTQENNNEKGGALEKNMLEQAGKHLHDLKKLMDSLKMEEQESVKLDDLEVRLAKLKLANVGEPVSVSKAKSSNTGPAADIIENLELAEALITTSENNTDEFSEKRASEAKRHLDEVEARCEKLRDRHQRSELLDRCRSMSARLQKIEEKKGEIVGKKVEELLNRANNAIRCFSSPVRGEEVKKVEDLFELAGKEIEEELSGSNYETIRDGLFSKFKQLKEKLQPYKVNISDRHQTTATNSEVKNRIDPSLDHYLKEYERKHKDLQEQLQRSRQYPIEQRAGKICDLREFCANTLKTAKELKLEKFAGLADYKKECLILNSHIETVRMDIEALDIQLEQLRKKRSDCMQS
ncbi:hypothetical protein, partial [Endozoicomonas sp. YOMI1]|uniref:hypothetical protein n=1 Tax=Endozoicomonas sp. YOMI1 TaxID=2828739 RepID=UPI002149993A